MPRVYLFNGPTNDFLPSQVERQGSVTHNFLLEICGVTRQICSSANLRTST
jgi:hypothetical protein